MSKVNSQRNNVKWSTLAVAISLVTPAILFAAEGDEQLVLEEIIVTAQKRGEERLIDHHGRECHQSGFVQRGVLASVDSRD